MWLVISIKKTTGRIFALFNKIFLYCCRLDSAQSNTLLRQKNFRTSILPIIIIFLACSLTTAYSSKEDDRIMQLLNILQQPDDTPPLPTQEMYSKDDIIFCTGDSDAANANNNAVKLIENGEFKSAAIMLEDALKHAPLFFPFRYNLGVCYIHLFDQQRALLHLEKAASIFPEFYKTYIQIAYIYEMQAQIENAIEYYRTALKKNRRAFEVFVLVGNIYFDRDQLKSAGKYYQAALDITPRLPNALLGTAKIHFKRKDFLKSMVIIRMISLAEEYDKSLHYYYAECAYQLRDYEKAYEEYNTMLKFKSDKFFIRISPELIKHKISLCQRFIEIKEKK